jgi:catechol 2,3-dioxygenase-like lactoylglutathione lyase family enzyme
VKLFRVIVPVSDIERATAFYAAVLGAPGTRVSPGRHYFDCEGTILACFDALADGDPAPVPPNPEHLYLAVDDLVAIHDRCRRAGAVFEESGRLGAGPPGRIAQRPWGETSFYVRDPFGNPLCFVDAGTVFTGAQELEDPT